MAKYKQKTYIMPGGNICKNLYAKTYNMQGKIYAKTYNMQRENISKDL